MMWWYGPGVSGWGMALMTIGNVLFWAVLIIGGITLTRYLTGRGRPTWPDSDRRSTPEQVLAERFARGEIDEHEYRSRLETLARPPGSPVDH